MNMTTEERKAIADTIVMQLGGTGRLSAMIGADLFSFGSNGELTFAFKMFRKANRIRIAVNSLDLYDITFYKYNKKTGDCPQVEEFNNVYASELRKTIENYTGLYLSL